MFGRDCVARTALVVTVRLGTLLQLDFAPIVSVRFGPVTRSSALYVDVGPANRD